jgi:hypothetical protein
MAHGASIDQSPIREIPKINNENSRIKDAIGMKDPFLQSMRVH